MSIEPTQADRATRTARFLADQKAAAAALAMLPDSTRARLEAWQTAQSEWFDGTVLEIVAEFIAFDDDHSTPASGEVAGWIVGNGSGTAWRTWDHVGNPCWTNDREKATRYARREDAELVHREDEDAWSVTPYAAPSHPAADLVEAAAKVHCDYYGGEGWWDDGFKASEKPKALEAMRAALSRYAGGA